MLIKFTALEVLQGVKVPLKDNVTFLHVQLKHVMCESTEQCAVASLCKFKYFNALYSKVATLAQSWSTKIPEFMQTTIATLLT